MKKWNHLFISTSVLMLSITTLAGCSNATTENQVGNTSQTTSETSNTASIGSNNTSSQPGNDTSNLANTTGSNTEVQTGGTTSSLQTQKPSSPFPAIIQMAMNHLSSSVRNDAWAPTIFPAAADGSTALFYKTRESTIPPMDMPEFVSTYEVNLSSSTHQIAQFSGTHYDSASKADAGLNFMGDVSVPEGPVSTIQLESGHTGQFSAAKSDGASMIYWTEGRWQIRVANNGNTSVPTKYANNVVNYLDAHFMPVPHDKGTIIVNLKGSIIETAVTWTEGPDLYTVQTNEYCKNPIQTALAMAIAMEPFKY